MLGNSVPHLLAKATVRLRRAGVEGPERDASILLEHAIGARLACLEENEYFSLSRKRRNAFEFLVRQRLSRQPVSQIVGRREFYGRVFLVTPDVLDPRPESETLINLARRSRFRSVLDVGTGSGCLLLTLLAEGIAETGIGIDVCDRALKVSTRNAETLGLGKICSFAQSNWFSAVEGKFDLIISNPPYISGNEFASLAPEVRLHEPRHALTLDGDGTEAYRILAGEAKNHLNSDGRLMIEIGSTQSKPVTKIFEKHGYRLNRAERDLEGNLRALELIEDDSHG
ncbi:MAG: peptide chain release factor N(5)-glutamine methyltransferase [Rhodobacteraceae bacterium]|nr:peptide chain release factor N(5)-glutamine methyltransferase [Paracoccaceae bacterium]